MSIESRIIEARGAELIVKSDPWSGGSVVPLEEAARLAAEFIGQFSHDCAKFYTNGEYGKPQERPGIGPSWAPATNATFDPGILVLCPGYAAW
jgi:hypothetical protein